MNNKKVKRFLGCVCALVLLLGSIPVDSMEAEAEDSTATTTYYDVLDDNELQLHGVTYDETEKIFKRMDLDTAAGIAGVDRATYSFLNSSDEFKNNVYSHAREAASGRIRFSTDSSYVAIKATLQNWDYTYADSMGDGKYGFDVYVDTADGSTYAGTVSVAETPTENGEVSVEGTVEFGSAETRNLTIYFPITIETKSVQIGVGTSSTIETHGINYQENERILFYGSSITQGGAVSKPGNTYANIVGRNLNMEYLNLGVWGSCKGQTAFAEYIAGLGDITAFVYDYDHNNATKEYLEETHYPFYEIIRTAYPEIPIIMITRPNNRLDGQHADEPDKYSTVDEMKAVIYASYEQAIENGDANVHFIDGESFFGYSTGYLADSVHPNDAGQAKMAEVVTAVLEKAFASETNVCVQAQADCKELLLNEDFENGVTSWTVQTETITPTVSAIEQDSGNTVCQLEYTRPATTNGYGGVQYSKGILANLSDYAVEMDATTYKSATLAKWSYLGMMFRDRATGGTCEIRIQPTSTGCKVTLYDKSSETTYTYEESIKDTSLADMRNNGTEFSYHLCVEINNVTNGDGSKSLVVSVSVNDSTVIFNFIPGDQSYAPTGLRVYMYGGSKNDTEADTYKATLDDIKVYNISKSNTLEMSHALSYVSEIPATTESTGKKAHYVCDVCGEKFLDEDGVIETTDADLVIAKCCSLFADDFENGDGGWEAKATNYSGNETFGIVKENGNSVYQMLVTRVSSNVSTYIVGNDPVLEGYSDYTVEMEETLYKASNGKWPTLTLMLKDRDSGYYDIRITPSTTGLKVVLRDRSDGSTNVDSTINVTDETLAYSDATTEISYKLRVVVDTYVTSDNTTKVKFLVYVGDNEAVEFDIEPTNQECTPTGLRVYLYPGTVTESTDFKATIDNIKVYKTSHTLSYVEKVASTDDTAGTKAHYVCEDCGKKFLDEAATVEVTDADLAYAKLTDIKCQTRVNENGFTDIRFVAFVDDYTQYQSVTFKITITSTGKSGTAICKDVYTAVYAGGEKFTTEDIYGTAGYFATFKLMNNTDEQLAEEMTVTVTWTAIDGTETTETRTICISQEQK